MNHSTTNTSSYTLSKYSRAYPGKKNAQRSGLSQATTVSTSEQAAQEWQHYTNPVIRVLLDTKISKDKDIESVRLRIIWQLNAGNEELVSQQDVVFEDIDLLSFSSITAPVAKKHQSEGLPLKAVYRDTTVGIRYFYSRDVDGIAPVYRRFQISFQSLSEASNFIDLIKPVCPCRLNPSSAPSFAVQRNQVTGSIREHSLQTHHRAPANTSVLPYRGSPLVHVAVPGTEEPRTQSIEPALSSLVQTSPILGRPYQTHVSSSMGQDLPPKTNPSISSNCDNTLPALQSALVAPLSTNTLSIYQSKKMPEQGITFSTEIISTAEGPPTVVAALSGLTSTEKAEIPCTPASVAGFKAEDANIYRISATSLEQAIGEIIQEEEFLQLVERISEMTSIRRVANV